MTPKVQILLLATCAFLYLIPGDALLCRMCDREPPEKTCSSDSVCETVTGVGACVTNHHYQDEKLYKIKHYCYPTTGSCDLGIDLYVINARNEITCCEDRDFCNDDL